jgi:hypothetical protein
MNLSAQTLPAALSATVLAVLAVMLAGSLAIFSLLARHVAKKHRLSVLRHWARKHGARLLEAPSRDPAPPPLKMLSPYHPRNKLTVAAANWAIVELTTDSPPEAKGNIPRWRLLAMQSDKMDQCPPTGLRPVRHVVSFIDLFGLSSFPSLNAPEGFVLFGSEPPFAAAFASALAEVPAGNLLPRDIGVLVCGQSLWLDFSGRSMEATELDRILELAGQLLPAIERIPLKQKTGRGQ